jgi:hypothetical protein
MLKITALITQTLVRRMAMGMGLAMFVTTVLMSITPVRKTVMVMEQEMYVTTAPLPQTARIVEHV